jgi:hypothetical protein
MFDPWSRKKTEDTFFWENFPGMQLSKQHLILIICLENESAKLTRAFAIKAFTAVIKNAAL